MKHGFEITRGSGFVITFEHGMTISVQFGSGNYCSRKDSPTYVANIILGHSSPNAEIAIYHPDTPSREWLTRKFDRTLNDDVKGWCDAEEVARAIAWTARYDKRLGKKLYGTTLEVIK
jgi:hypothetical protein